MARFPSYAEQAAHYFDRPHEGIRLEPVTAPAAWRGGELADSEAWRVELGPAEREELEAALAHARATGRPTAELEARDFPLPTLGVEVARWQRELTRGRGFLVVSGMPVEGWSPEDAERAFWCLGLHLGRPGAQNPKGDLVGHVLDTGEETADPYVRLYRTASEIAWHCDAADAVGLLCLSAARRGGRSRLVSSVAVFNQLLSERPDLVPRLFEPFLLDVRNEDASGRLRYLPVPPCRFASGILRTFWHSDYFRSVARHPDVPPFDAPQRELLALYDQIASRPEMHLEMELAPGDIQWLSNHTVVHGRTAYRDDPAAGRKRHLLRLWLSLD